MDQRGANDGSHRKDGNDGKGLAPHRVPSLPSLPSVPSVRRPRPRFELFGAWRHRNFRLFFSGYIVSLVGIWMQRVAQSWLVLDLTDSAFWVGLVEALGSIPVLLFSLYAGALADRVSKRWMVFITQTVAMLLAFTLASAVLTGRVALWHVVVVAALVGVANAFDIPARQSFWVDLVGKRDLMNAIALNSSAFNASRMVGPAVGGVVIAAFGVGACFLINGFTFLPLLVGLLALRLPATSADAGAGVSTADRIKEGLRYARSDVRLRQLIANVAVVSVFGFAILVLLPVLARDVLGRGAEAYGWMMSAVGVGAMIGAIGLAGAANWLPKGKLLGWATFGFGVLTTTVAYVRWLPAVLALLALVGFAMITTTALTNTLLQTLAPDHLRGRVVSLYVFAFVGMAPFGAFLAGTLAEIAGTPEAIALGGAVTALSALLGPMRSKVIRETV